MRILPVLTAAACIAAVATPALTRPWGAYHCGSLQIAYIPSKYFSPRPGVRCGEPCDWAPHFYNMKTDPEQKHPLPIKLFGWNDGPVYKGAQCSQFTEEEYEALDRPKPPSAPATADTGSR
jgi:hypothetical protein